MEVLCQSFFWNTARLFMCFQHHQVVSAIVYGQKEALQSALYGNNDLSRPVLYKSLRPEYKYVQCLSSVQCFKQKVDHKDPGVVAMDCM